MASYGINPYKIAYALILAALAWGSGLWPFDAYPVEWLLGTAYVAAHLTFRWFKRLAYRKIIVFDMHGVITTQADFYTQKLSPEPRTVELVIRLRRKYVTALLSNNNALFSHGARRIFPMDAMFDYEFYTSMLGAKKPDETAYRRFLTYTGFRPQDMVFIDDVEENVKGAAKLGIHGIHYKNAHQLQECLAALGITPG